LYNRNHTKSSQTLSTAHAQSIKVVVLNRGCTYHLGVRGAKAGGTKHQRICDTMWTTLV